MLQECTWSGGDCQEVPSLLHTFSLGIDNDSRDLIHTGSETVQDAWEHIPGIDQIR